MNAVDDQVLWIKTAISAAEVAGFRNTATALNRMLSQEMRAKSADAVDAQPDEESTFILSH